MSDTKRTCPECAKKTKRDEQLKLKLANRLKRMEGQLRGLRTMVENDAYCNDILIQSASVVSAMNGFNRELLANHIRSCVANDLRDGNNQVVDELCDTLRLLMK